MLYGFSIPCHNSSASFASFSPSTSFFPRHSTQARLAFAIAMYSTIFSSSASTSVLSASVLHRGTSPRRRYATARYVRQRACKTRSPVRSAILNALPHCAAASSRSPWNNSINPKTKLTCGVSAGLFASSLAATARLASCTHSSDGWKRESINIQRASVLKNFDRCQAAPRSSIRVRNWSATSYISFTIPCQ